MDREAAQAAFDRQQQADAVGDRVMLWFAMLMGVLLAGPTLAAEIAAAPLLVFFFVRIRNTLGTWVHWFGQPMFLLVLMFAGWQALSLTWSGDLVQGLDELGRTRWALIGGLVWPILHQRRAILASLAVGFALGHLSQLLQLAELRLGVDTPTFTRDPRRLSGWWDPVVGGSLLTAAVGLHLPSALFGAGRTKWLARLGVLAATLGVLATGTRGAWLATAALLGFGLVVALVRRGRTKPELPEVPQHTTGPNAARGLKLAGWSVLTLAVLGFVAWFGFGSAIGSRVDQARSELVAALEGDTDSDIGRRLDMAEWAGRALLTNPIQGVGAGGYREWVASQDGPPVFDHAHNSALHIAATTGLVGLALWGMILLVLWRNAMRDPRKLGDPAAPPLFALLGLVLVSAFDPVHLNGQTAAVFWLLAGMTVTWQPTLPASRDATQSENQGGNASTS